jgi:hypothetical protein
VKILHSPLIENCKLFKLPNVESTQIPEPPTQPLVYSMKPSSEVSNEFNEIENQHMKISRYTQCPNFKIMDVLPKIAKGHHKSSS